jgi:hypothetical protein
VRRVGTGLPPTTGKNTRVEKGPDGDEHVWVTSYPVNIGGGGPDVSTAVVAETILFDTLTKYAG